MVHQIDRETGEVVPVQNADPDVFVEMDRLDEEQILRSLQGGAIEEYVYSFSQGGQTVVGLSWTGARELARSLTGIQMEDPQITQDDDQITVLIAGRDVNRQTRLFAVAQQAKLEKRRNGESVTDKFALAKALSKAQRNAILALAPTAVIVATIKHFLEQGTTRSSGRGQSTARPAVNGRAATPALPAAQADRMTSEERDALQDLLVEAGQDVPDVCQKMGIQSLLDLTPAKAAQLRTRAHQLIAARKAERAVTSDDLPFANPEGTA